MAKSLINTYSTKWQNKLGIFSICDHITTECAGEPPNLIEPWYSIPLATHASIVLDDFCTFVCHYKLLTVVILNFFGDDFACFFSLRNGTNQNIT